MAEEFPVASAAPSLQLFQQLGLRPPPSMTVYNAILPVIDVTPKLSVSKRAALLVQTNALGSFAAPTVGPRYAGARFVGTAGAALNLDAITNIPSGCIFKVAFGCTTDSATAQNFIASLQDQAGTVNLCQWSQLIRIDLDAIKFESAWLEAPAELKLNLQAALVAGATYFPWYNIEVAETRS